MPNAILLVSCPDKKGINARISDFIYKSNGNIEHYDQHIDNQLNTFFMRIEWSLENFKIDKGKIYQELLPLIEEFEMHCNLYFTDAIPRVAIFVSKYSHCLHDILLRYKAGQLKCEIPLIMSNHRDVCDIAKSFNIKFKEFAVTKENKIEQERNQISILKGENIDTIVLARYMQIFSEQFIMEFPNNIINIHHSFLPAFVGKDPYRRAYEKGVKIIGATSHYVTQELDAGPIIEQDTVRISHRDCLDDLIREGQDLEKTVLSRAIRWHLERKILTYNNKTVVFD